MKNRNLIKHVNWNEIPTEQVTPKMSRQIVYGKEIMIAKMKFEDGFIVPKHQHHNEQITHVLSGEIRFWLGEDESEVIVLKAGDILVIPANIPHKAKMIGKVEEIDTWAPPRQDWLDGTDNYLKS